MDQVVRLESNAGVRRYRVINVEPFYVDTGVPTPEGATIYTPGTIIVDLEEIRPSGREELPPM